MIYTQSSNNCVYSAKFNSFYNYIFSNSDEISQKYHFKDWKRVKYSETYLILVCHLWHILCTLLSTFSVYISCTVASPQYHQPGWCYAMTKILCKLHSFCIRMSIFFLGLINVRMSFWPLEVGNNPKMFLIMLQSFYHQWAGFLKAWLS